MTAAAQTATLAAPLDRVEHGTGPVAPPDRTAPVRLWPGHRRNIEAVAFRTNGNAVMPPGMT